MDTNISFNYSVYVLNNLEKIYLHRELMYAFIKDLRTMNFIYTRPGPRLMTDTQHSTLKTPCI